VTEPGGVVGKRRGLWLVDGLNGAEWEVYGDYGDYC
jgi:hypothetical protein